MGRALLQFYYRYRITEHAKVDGDEPKARDLSVYLGRFDPAGKNGGITLAQARERLWAVRDDKRKHGDVKAYLEQRAEQERIERETELRRQREALEIQRAEDARKLAEAKHGTLRQLLDAYVQSLRDAGKVSANAVEGIFRRNVLDPFPELADTKANAITPEDVQKILNRMVRKHITRQVNVTRSYLRAAFHHGRRSHLDPTNDAQADSPFGLTHNPVADVPAVRKFERAGNRALSDAELRAYWNALETLPLVTRCALRFNLALACQRPTQLLRAKWAAFDFASRIQKDAAGKNQEMGLSLLLRDAKGQGKERDHLLPLTAFALEQIKPLRQMNGKAKSGGPFTSDGKRSTTPDTLSHAVREVSDELKKAPHKVPAFQLRDLRRTAETMLQSLGVDKEVRAHLLSHGRGQGVQGRHYERYDFLPEKRAALERWALHLERIITGKSADVVPITAGARSPRGRRAVGAK